jgi:hypothetical protein
MLFRLVTAGGDAVLSAWNLSPPAEAVAAEASLQAALQPAFLPFKAGHVADTVVGEGILSVLS